MSKPRVDPLEGISKNKIQKSGKLLQNLDRIDFTPSAEDVFEALQVVQAFRDAHAYPMLKVRVGLEGFINTTGVDAVAAQRHKRVPRILRKLRRMRDRGGGTNLARLEDIGGCRVVLANAADLNRLLAHIRRRWSGSFTRDPRDYIEQPKPMGYRAVHVVVVRDGRAVEVQLRTRGQQQWADAVEAADARLGGLPLGSGLPLVNLKDEEGPEDLKNYFRVSGEYIYRREHGLAIDPVFADEFDAARQAVLEAGYYTA